MKALIKSILVVAVLLSTGVSYGFATLEVLPTNNFVNKGDYISVADAKGQIVYSGRINYSGNLAHLFDFSQLKDGTYTIEINKDFEIEINTIKVKNSEVTFIESAKDKIYKPVFRTQDSKVLISKLALDTDEMEVELYFEDELIHTETIKGNAILNRIYKLDESLNGEYRAVIKANDRVFIENFSI